EVGRARPQRALPDAAGAAPMTAPTFPSVAWFQRLADAMAAQPEKYRRLGPLDLTLIVRVVYPDGTDECHALEFDGARCVAITRLTDVAAVSGRPPAVPAAGHPAW